MPPVDLATLAQIIDGVKTHPANPATGSEGAENPVPDGEKPCRVEYPAPTRHHPAKPGTPPLAGGLPGTAGCLPGEVPGTDFADGDGQKPPLEGGLPGLPGGFSGGSVQVALTPPPVVLVEDLASLEALLPLLAREEAVGADLETTGLDPLTAKVRLASFYLPSEGKAYVLDLFRLGEGVVEKLFSGEGPGLVGHNLGFDLGFLMARGLYPLGLPWDTGLVDQVLGHRARMRPLEEVAREAGITLDKALQTSDWASALSQEQIAYAGLDAWAAWAIRQAQEPEVNRLGLREVVALEMAALPAAVLMRLRGVPFDPGIWEEAVREAEARREEALARLREFEAGLLQGAVNWDSPQQALKALKALGLDLPDTREDTLASTGSTPP